MLLTIEAGPSIATNDVDGVESRYRIRLPEAYRHFLVTQNGGRPVRDLVRVPECKANPIARVHFFFGIGDPVESCDLAWNIDVFKERLPAGVLPIATTEGADKICLVMRTGEIVYWDGYDDVIYPICNNFERLTELLFRDELSPRVSPS